MAVPSPLRRLFDYLPPADMVAVPRPGQRYWLPFGRTRCVGVLTNR
ncbi:MAG: hypothetical protein R6X32_11805 [Chloroflexota bacterium]